MYHGHSYQRFAGARYRGPRDYRYRRWGIGSRLPREYWVSDYYIDDYADYDLAPPPDGYQWVRYGPDVLMVNTGDGQVAQSAYGVFDESGGGGGDDAGADGGDQEPQE